MTPSGLIPRSEKWSLTSAASSLGGDLRAMQGHETLQSGVKSAKGYHCV
ncbi:hypothetical protein SAMN03159306_05428 [Pseudomonas sp. NFACC48-1]|nr:hypothetical protein SAMN03159405_04276 [Pseudomonas sp. NFACC44-2]SDA89824.1 hypothetical protein SAMN03159429_05672 [Pseudomonas sp. NFACC51]SDW42626.1 hypothetical protein SAMN03159474_00834 [Pseudomonas sp. NFACC08-1]SFI16590.1 hypothetical protein SAMN03159302_03576 [Pseudomonas sp. NFACC54]SFT28415.1 hypothetical protein SAMN03159306_05428 [Pseudomonas sp. NFACC48-1]